MQAGTEEEEAQRTVQAALKIRGKGSILRGWRQELDPDGSLDCNFLEFCQAAKRLHLAVDAPKLFGADSPETLELGEVMPYLGALLDRFRGWMVQEFGGPSDMCLAFEGLEDCTDGMMSEDMFYRGCAHFGFEAKPADLRELFCLLDSEETGSVAAEDVMFLEVDVKKREGALKKAKEKREAQYIKELTAAYRDDTTNALPWHHRRAPRAWNAALFERLPALICEKKRDQRAEEHRRRVEARATFMRHIQDAFGDPVRAWRRGLDLDCRYQLSRATLSKYCSHNGLKVNVADLWKAFDQDGDGVIRLEEIGPSHSAVFANLQEWSKKMFGSCAGIWSTPEADEVRSEYQCKGTWMSPKKMPLRAFGKLLRELGWPLLGRPGMPDAPVLLKGLDFYNCGFLSIKDLEWLDAWEAPPWLSAEPDQQAWEKLREMMLAVYHEPLRAWRRCLDTDDSNCVSYVEFLQAVKQLRFTGNADGAWRYLDRDISGTISLTEFDPRAADLLKSFKGWMENNFGAVEAAFRSMDTDGSGALSFSELKRMTKRVPWEGDVAVLFDCLAIAKAPGKRTLSFKDLEFLDYWMPESIQEAVQNLESASTSSAKPSPTRKTSAMMPPDIPSSPSPPPPPARPVLRTFQEKTLNKGQSLEKLPQIGGASRREPDDFDRHERGSLGKGALTTSKHALEKAYSAQPSQKGWFPPYLLAPATPEGPGKGMQKVTSLPSIRRPPLQAKMQSISPPPKGPRRRHNW